ncbi:MAG: hypothetical protein JOZ98_23885 [Solirubrobacterales bacterium]|nr:hypothetical protein [Solirubrobacterales bacterium]
MASGEERSPWATRLPSQVQVTVLADPRPRPRWGRIARAPTQVKALAAGGVALLVAAIIATVVASLPGDRVGGPGAVPALARLPGPAGVAAAYGFPRRCLTVTVLSRDPGYARADFNRGTECGRYNGDVTAIFERVAGAWRPVLHAVEYVCPVRSLPSAVQAQLAVCQQP